MALFFTGGVNGASAGQNGKNEVAAKGIESVSSGLARMSTGGGDPSLKSGPVVSRGVTEAARVSFSDSVRQALRGKQKAPALIATVADHVNRGLDESHVKAAFESYTTEAPRGFFSTTQRLSTNDAAERIQKLSQAAHEYVSNSEYSLPTRDVISRALKAVLAAHLTDIVTEFESEGTPPMSENSLKAFFDRKAPFVKLPDGRVNPFLFPDDTPAARDMCPIVDAVNGHLGGEPLSHKARIDLTTHAQSRSQIDGSVHDQFVKFERTDLRICGDLDSSTDNAYTILGLHSGVDHEDLQRQLTALSDSGYVVNGAVDSRLRNAAFQLQTRDGRAAYDEYLESKTSPDKKRELQSRVVSESEGYRTGIHPRSFLMNALLYCIKTHK